MGMASAAVREWEVACSLAQALANDPRCNIQMGRHERTVVMDGGGRTTTMTTTDTHTRPLAELLAGDGLALDCVLMLLLHGGEESEEVREALEAQLAAQDRWAGSAGARRDCLEQPVMARMGGLSTAPALPDTSRYAQQ